MDWIFRRFFGRTNEEIAETGSESTAVDEEQETSDDLDIDEATLPVNVSPTIAVREGVTQQLNPEVLNTQRNENFSFGQSTDVGLVRNNNQDAALSFFLDHESIDKYPTIGLFVVADGMGGHHDGEKASAIVTRVLATVVMNEIQLPILSGVDPSDQVPINEALVTAVQKANIEVMRHVPEGGTTVTGVVLMGDLVHLVHVGDSRAYMITESKIEQVTRDHSLVQRLIELDQLTREEAENHPQKNVLYRAIGQSESLEVDVQTIRLTPNSRLLICSDGLWGQVEESELFEVSMNHHNPQEACDKLVALANTRGGPDNITAILLKVS